MGKGTNPSPALNEPLPSEPLPSPVSEITYTVSSGTLNSTIAYYSPSAQLVPTRGHIVLTLLRVTDVTVVHVGDLYAHSPPSISAVVKDASAVAKDHILPAASRCDGNNAACLRSKAGAEPVSGCKDLANQRSLSDKFDLSVASAGS